MNLPPKRKPPINFAGMNTEASLWILIPIAFTEILFSCVLVLLRFWLEFGELSPLAWGCAAFFAILTILIIIGLRFQNRPEVHTTVAARGDWIDKIGAWWLMACAFGALLGWVCGQMANGFPRYRQIFLVAEIIFTIVLPFVTMLPNVRYVSRNAAYIQVPLLVLITVLPVLVGIDAVVELIGQ